jgi:chlorite dismutase
MFPMFTIFRGGRSGAWRVTRFAAVRGASLAPTPALSVVHSLSIALPIMPSPTSWRLAGVASHLRYTERPEKEQLVAVQAEIGRPEATYAALIPIKKSAAWWELTQEERRQIFEDRSHHIAASLKYLPAVARQLYHCRDLGEPFDFLTWFEYAPADADTFEELVRTLRATEEWRYVEREVDIRMERERLDAG